MDKRIKPTDLKYVAFGANPDELVTYGDDGMVRIWKVSTGRVFFSVRWPDRDIRVISLREGTMSIVSGAYHGTGQVLDPLVIGTIKVEPNAALP